MKIVIHFSFESFLIIKFKIIPLNEIIIYIIKYRNAKKELIQFTGLQMGQIKSSG